MMNEIIRRREDVLEANFGNEKLLMNLANNMPYILNTIASQLWDICKKPRSTTDLILRISREFAIDQERAKNDIQKWVKNLEARGLIKLE